MLYTLVSYICKCSSDLPFDLDNNINSVIPQRGFEENSIYADYTPILAGSKADSPLVGKCLGPCLSSPTILTECFVHFILGKLFFFSASLFTFKHFQFEI